MSTEIDINAIESQNNDKFKCHFKGKIAGITLEYFSGISTRDMKIHAINFQRDPQTLNNLSQLSLILHIRINIETSI